MVLHEIPRVVMVPHFPWVVSTEIHDVRPAGIRRLAREREQRDEIVPAAERRRAARQAGHIGRRNSCWIGVFTEVGMIG